MTVPSKYTSGPVEIGANTYSTPVNNLIGDALSSVINIFGQTERASTLSGIQSTVEQEREQFFGTGTEAQSEIARAVEAQSIANAGGELSEKQREDLNAIKGKTAQLQAAVEQGVMKKHTFSRRMETMLRDAKRERPDLAQELDKMYADTLGFDVRGAAMDYYNYTLQQYAKLGEAEAGKKAATANAITARASIVKEMIKGLPESDKVSAEKLMRDGEMLANKTGDMSSFGVIVDELYNKFGTVESEARATAVTNAKSFLTEITTNASALAKSLTDGSNMNLAGELPPEVQSELSKQIVRIDANIASLANVGGKEPEALIKLLTEEREGLVNAQKTNTLGAVIEHSKQVSERAQLMLDPNQEARLLDASRVMGVPDTERQKFVRDLAPAIKAGEQIGNQFLTRQTKPWEAKYPAGVPDKIGGAVVKKVLDRLGSVDKPEQAAEVIPVAIDALYAYGAKRVDAQGRTQVRMPNEIFGSGGSLSAIGDKNFLGGDAAKRMLALPELERAQIAFGLAMNLDRYNESVAASAAASDPSLPNIPVRASQLLDLVLDGKLPATSKYDVVHSSMRKTEAGNATVEQRNGYSEQASNTWRFIMELTK